MRKILILSANPKNTDPLRLEEEKREIKAALRRSRSREQFEIVTEGALRVEDLYRALLDHEPQILHFSGHGGGSDGLVLENNLGKMQFVSTDALAKLFELFQKKIECVFLNACYSEVQAEAIHQHINYVVGMNQPIGDRAAIKFAIGFYDALGAGRSIEEAFAIGCTAVDLSGIPESMTPVLKAREGAIDSSSEHKLVEPSLLKTDSVEATPMMPEQKISQSFSMSGGTITGQFVQAGGDVTQTQQIHQGSAEKQLTVSEVVALIAQIEALFNTSALPDEQKHKATTHLEAAREAVQEKEPDKSYAAKSLQKATKILKEANEAAEVGQLLWNRVEPILRQLLPWLGTASHLIGL